jgi:hypothetical protein
MDKIICEDNVTDLRAGAALKAAGIAKPDRLI